VLAGVGRVCYYHLASSRLLTSGDAGSVRQLAR